MPFLKILRPFNCLFVAITVLFGALISNTVGHVVPLIFAVLSATFIAAAGYVMNDFFDLPIDKINRPYRMLPAGKISPQSAYFYAVVLFMLGILFSFLTQKFLCVGMAVFNSLALFYYAKFFKMKFLIGNLIVAYAAGSTFIFGGICNDNLINCLQISIYAFLFTLLREFIKDAEDSEGDLQFGASTLAVKLGSQKTVIVSLLPVLALIYYTFFNFQHDLMEIGTFKFLHIFVSVPLVFFFILLLAKPQRRYFALTSTAMKLDMVVLMIILWVGQYESL
ncbi:MAG TPA: geranylgeranylglycerol-phosphate geranylgeranyltransferase [Candidatus Cloacimonadota bacterium]|nr:geranylgeranylglycerol-phosphate geranylgeranyltransferase [Candidatus Cloacimonadota bacterium]